MPPRKREVEATPSETGPLVARGEDAAKLLDDASYFAGLIERMDAAYRDAILSLRPDDAAKFTAYQERRQGLLDLRGSIIGDIEAGKRALASAQGETTKQGRMA